MPGIRPAKNCLAERDIAPDRQKRQQPTGLQDVAEMRGANGGQAIVIPRVPNSAKVYRLACAWRQQKPACT